MSNSVRNHGEDSPLREIAQQARKAARQLATMSDHHRREALLAAADAILEHTDEILAANREDTSEALRLAGQGNMTCSMLDRLKTSEHGIAEMASRVRDVADLPNPLGRTLAATELDTGLTLYKVSCPLGVVGIIFESRPDVIPQVAALALKSGNAVIFKGGIEAARTNEVLASIWRNALSQRDAMPTDSIALLHTREDVAGLLTLSDEIDLIIPRGSKEFVSYVTEASRIPVLGHGEGVCHVYVDRAAEITKALAIPFDSKVQYPAACNSMETLLVHEAIAGAFLPQMIRKFKSAGVEMRGCKRTIAVAPADVIAADQSDWAREYSDLIVSIRVVGSADEAIEHIQNYGSRHTESIVTEDLDLAKRFIEAVDAAGVFHNASTRFADGYRYGLGAELGISTGKLHARGPVGLEGLTTYKYQLFGDGHTVASYSEGWRSFKHRALSKQVYE